MRYIDAGYAVALGTLALYAVGLVVRRHRLERTVRSSGSPAAGVEPPRSS